MGGEMIAAEIQIESEERFPPGRCPAGLHSLTGAALIAASILSDVWTLDFERPERIMTSIEFINRSG